MSLLKGGRAKRGQGRHAARERGLSDTKTLAKGAGVNLGGHLTGTVLQFLVHITLARMLGPHDYGIYALAWTVLRISRLFSTFGLDKGVLRFGAEHYPDNRAGLKEVLIQTSGMTLMAGLFFGGLMFFLAPVIAIGMFNEPGLVEVLRFVSFLLLIIPALRLTASMTRLTEKMGYSNFTINILQPALNIASILVLVGFLDMGLRGAILALYISFTSALLVSIFQVWMIYHGALKVKSRLSLWSTRILLFSIPASMTGMLTKLNAWIDRLFIGHYLSSSDTGIYVAASQVANLFSVITIVFGLIFSAMIAKLFVRKEHDRIEALYRVSTKWGLYLSLIYFMIVVFFPEKIMTLAFGDQYILGTTPMLVLVCAQLLRVSIGPVGMLLVMSDNQNKWLVLTALTVVVNIVLNNLLIPRFGMFGGALATAISVAVLFPSGLLMVRKVLNMGPHDRRFIKGIMAAAVVAGGMYLWRLGAPESRLITLMVAVIIAPVLFAVTMKILGFDREDKELFFLIRKRFGR